MDNALQQALKMISGSIKSGINAGQTIGNNIGNVVSTFTNNPQTLPQDYQYRFKKLSNQGEAASPNLIHVGFNNQNSPTNQTIGKMYDKTTPMGQQALNAFMFPENQQTKGDSANYDHFYYEGPQQTAYGQKLKQSITANPNFLPGAQDYLNTIPVAPGNLYPQHAAGLTVTYPGGQPYTLYDKHFPQEKGDYPQEVVAHEMMHQAVNVFGRAQLGNFVQDFNKALQKDPQKYAQIVDYIQKYKQDPHYKQGYFKDPLAEANELFAEIGARYGPALVSDPNLGKYYAKVFNAPQQQKTPPTAFVGQRQAQASEQSQSARKVKVKK